MERDSKISQSQSRYNVNTLLVVRQIVYIAKALISSRDVLTFQLHTQCLSKECKNKYWVELNFKDLTIFEVDGMNGNWNSKMLQWGQPLRVWGGDQVFIGGVGICRLCVTHSHYVSSSTAALWPVNKKHKRSYRPATIKLHDIGTFLQISELLGIRQELCHFHGNLTKK